MSHESCRRLRFRKCRNIFGFISFRHWCNISMRADYVTMIIDYFDEDETWWNVLSPAGEILITLLIRHFHFFVPNIIFVIEMMRNGGRNIFIFFRPAETFDVAFFLSPFFMTLRQEDITFMKTGWWHYHYGETLLSAKDEEAMYAIERYWDKHYDMTLMRWKHCHYAIDLFFRWFSRHWWCELMWNMMHRFSRLRLWVVAVHFPWVEALTIYADYFIFRWCDAVDTFHAHFHGAEIFIIS